MDVKLVKFSKKHLPDSRRWMNDRELCQLFGRVYRRFTVAAQKKWYKNVIKDKSQLVLAIEVDGVYVGNIGLKNINRIDKNCEYYIFIGDKSYRGKGIGEIGTKKIIDYIKNNLKMRKVYLYVDESNKPARALYNKIGFIKKGVLKDETLREGKYHTMIKMAYFL